MSKTTLNWPGIGFLLLTPVFAIALTIYHLQTEGFLWQIWLLAAVFYWLTAGSITAGYHRYFAHKTYECKPWVQWFWALFGAASVQNSILIWARDHRIHHRFVDTDNDPYSINKGFFYAHFGWMLVNEVPAIDIKPYGRDLEKHPIVAFQHKYYVPISMLMCFGLPTLLGYFLGSALGGFAIAGCLRVFLVHHATFCINSWCHYWGKQTYTDTNTARDSLFMALATFGEGYHNFHHLFANDYRNGVRWYHWDPTKWVIQFLNLIGAAHSLNRTPRREILRAQLQMDELILKSRLKTGWQNQFQEQLDQLKSRIVNAQARLDQMREEYKQLKQTSLDRIEEVREQLRQAKLEIRMALKQWREYNSFLMQTCAVPI